MAIPEHLTSTPRDESRPSRPRTFVTVLGLYAVAGGMISFIGWAADVRRLTDWYNNGISIQPNTTVAVMCAGLAVLFLASGNRRVSASLGVIVGFIGFTALVQYLVDIDFSRLNTLLMFGREWGRVGVVDPGRMGPPGAMSWTLLGISLVLGSGIWPRLKGAMPGIAMATLTIGMLSIAGYFYGAGRLYSLPYVTVIALQTATFIAAVSLAIIASAPEQGPARWFLDNGAAGAVARQAVPLIVLFPFMAGWLRLWGERSGWYDTSFGTAILVIFLIILLLAVLSWTLRTVSQHERALRASEQRMAATLELRTRDLAGLSRLQALSTKLVQRGDLDSLLSEILSAAADLTGTTKGNIQFYSSDTDQLRIFVHQGLGEEFIRHFANQGAPRGCELAARTLKRVICQDLKAEAEWTGTESLRVLLAEGVLGFQSTPLVSREGRLLGILSTHTTEPYHPTERELRHLDLLARMAADFIERSQSEQALQDADRAKDEFLAMLAHELRSPLAPIQNAVQMLRMSADGDDRLRTTTDMLTRQVAQLVHLVDDLVDVSRITRGKIDLVKQPVDLSTVVRQAIETVEPLVRVKRQELEVVMPSAATVLEADAARLTQVVGNMLSNASKYSPVGGRVELTVSREPDGEVAIRVRDNGIGISAEHLPRIFDLFMQGDSSLERSAGGLGIGLTLVKTLVEMHGGTITAQSAGRGKGSEFVVRLPRSHAGDGDGKPATRLHDAPSVVQPRRVLIVDDNEDGAVSLATILSLSGHATRTAHDGEAAVEMAEQFRPDVVLLDIGLPKLNGYEACRRIREQPWGKEMLLVAVTGWGASTYRERSTEAGFDTHVVKPVDSDTLIRLVHRGPAAMQQRD